MANEIRTKLGTLAAVTITLSSLTNGSGRQSTLITNSGGYPGAMIYVKMRSNAAPTAGSTYDVYLIRADAASPAITTDGAGASDAALTVLNAKCIGSIQLSASATTDFQAEFDTAIAGPLGARWGIAIVNRSGQTTGTTAGDHVVNYVPYLPEIQ